MKIQELLPHLKKGYVAMDKDGIWCWYKSKPSRDLHEGCWWAIRDSEVYLISREALPIEFDGDWKDSLMECGK